MRRNVNMNCYVNQHLAKQFREAVKHYDDRIGFCVSAALLMWLEAEPKVQGDYLKRVFQLDLGDQVEDMLRAVKEEQVRRVEQSERAETGKSDKPRRGRGQA
jgi:hypothetical protein